MRKLMLLAAMLAMVLVATVPALAQVDQSIDDVESGDATGGGVSDVVGCGQVLNAINTGNVVAQQYTEQDQYVDQYQYIIDVDADDDNVFEQNQEAVQFNAQVGAITIDASQHQSCDNVANDFVFFWFW